MEFRGRAQQQRRRTNREHETWILVTMSLSPGWPKWSRLVATRPQTVGIFSQRRRGLFPPLSLPLLLLQPAMRKARKKPNYLHHWERCAIIKRVAEGEPQAALAREFGVTRAAVCQMYKNRKKILAHEPSSEEELEPSPAPAPSPPAPQTIASRSKTVALLLATLKARGTNPAATRRAAARLTFILIEEVIASFDTLNEPTGATEQSFSASEQIIPFCGVVLGDESAAFARAFEQLDPGAPTGQIQVKMDVVDDGRVCWRLVYLDVPEDVSSYEVLVFSTFGNGGAECRAIEALRRVGILEQRISLVMVACTSLGYKEISTRFPRVAVTLGALDDDWSIQGGVQQQNGPLKLLVGPRRTRSRKKPE